MLETGALTLEKMFVLFLFIALGYVMARKQILPETAGKTLAKLGTLVFFPAYLIDNLSRNFTRTMLAEDGKLFLYGVLFATGSLLLAWLLAIALHRVDVGLEQGAMVYVFAFSNYGYFGYPVMRGVDGFGETFVTKTIVYCLTCTVLIASVGYVLLTGKNKGGWLKTLLSPTIIAIVIGLAIGLSGLKMPGFVTDTLSTAAACMSPVSMLLTGFVLGRFRLKELFGAGGPYAVAVIRLLGFPAVVGGMLYLWGVRGMLFAIPTIVSAMPVGMNTVMFPSGAGKDASQNARACFASYFLGILTIPIVFAVVKAVM